MKRIIICFVILSVSLESFGQEKENSFYPFEKLPTILSNYMFDHYLSIFNNLKEDGFIYNKEYSDHNKMLIFERNIKDEFLLMSTQTIGDSIVIYGIRHGFNDKNQEQKTIEKLKSLNHYVPDYPENTENAFKEVLKYRPNKNGDYTTSSFIMYGYNLRQNIFEYDINFIYKTRYPKTLNIDDFYYLYESLAE